MKIEDKEFIVFVGLSGCGKFIIFCMIVGFEDISLGELYIDEEYKNDIVLKDRDIVMVF